MKALNLTIALILTVPVTTAAQTAPMTAAFDWRVPDRLTEKGMTGVRLPFAGLDKAESKANLRFLNPERAFGKIAPAGWPAIFDACASTGVIASYIWSVDGARAAESIRCKPTTIRFPREGRYRVELTVVASSGARVTTAQDVNIQDWLIIGLGDSYASGEGVPNVAVTPKRYVDLSIAEALADDARVRLDQLLAEVAAAQAEVDAARADLIAARRDWDNLQAAFEAFTRAVENLAAAELALVKAKAVMVAATARVVEATAVMLFECAQWWDPAGCTEAKAALAAAKAAESAAILAHQKALADRDAAAVEAARAALTVPVGGFEDALEILSARVELIKAQLNTLETLLEGVKHLKALAAEAYASALTTLHRRSQGIVAKWQDSVKVPGGVIYPEKPFYRPNPYSQCHQSNAAGQALAALKIERDDPKTSVTFIHLACTGATVYEGLLGKQYGVEPRPEGIVDRSAQLPKAAALSEGREVDAFVMSIGGNDVKFAKAIEKCVLTEPCFSSIEVQTISDDTIAAFCDPSALWTSAVTPGAMCFEWLKNLFTLGPGEENASQLFEGGLKTLPEKYAAVQGAIAASWPDLPANRVFITPYPIVTRNQDGNICGFNPAKSLPGVSPAEYLWAEQVVTKNLNDTIVRHAGIHGWTVVEGIDTSFLPHGYCSDDTWMVRVDDSFTRQAGHMGIAHPNAAGHNAYAEKILASLVAAFYPEATKTSLGPARVDRRP